MANTSGLEERAVVLRGSGGGREQESQAIERTELSTGMFAG